MLWKKENKPLTRRAIAYYRHSAQDRQENSVEIQQDQVRKFALDNGIEIIKEFADRGKSGLSVEGRDSFTEMINDYVVGGKAIFELILVLDVSRWGRFQETDRSAYFASLCLQHGVQVVFTTIGFPKDNDLLHGLHLSIERYRAASYSRELSGKVWKGCAKIASGGYWAGGSPPYAMCRVLLDEKRQPLQVLAHGEHKAIHNQRVTLGPGDGTEIANVRSIFASYVESEMLPDAIAALLNDRGSPAPGRGLWSASAICAILRNEIYAGAMIWNKSSQKMKSKSHANPIGDWIRTEGAFDAVVSRELFNEAQRRLREREEAERYRYSEIGMLAGLKGLIDQYGTISQRMVSATKSLPSPSTYQSRFHGVDMAYQALYRDVIADRRAQIVESMRQAALGIEQFNDFLVIENYFSIAIQPCVPIAHGYEAYWVFQPDQRVEVDLTIGVPLSCPGDLNVLGYFFFPRMLFQTKVRIQSNSTDRANLHACNLLELINELKR